MTASDAVHVRVPRAAPAFVFLHHESHKPLAWARYKLKECWTLVLCLLALRGYTRAVIVHNWWNGSSLRFTQDFRDRHACRVDPRLAEAPLLEAHAASRVKRALALVPAAFLALLPVRALVAMTAALSPSRAGPLVVFCDGHLSGFVLVLAARRRGQPTITLHHGLYRFDDIGSIMCIRNFVADQICLWDGCTERAFLEAGHDPARLLRTGQYGFAELEVAVSTDDCLVMLCPPYNERQIAVFKHLASIMPEAARTLWSLHPQLRKTLPDLEQTPIATVAPRPTVAICGDSGALMDALARHIPIVTVSERSLAGSHMTLEEARDADAAKLAVLVAQALDSLEADRLLFGFASRPTENWESC